MSRRCHHGSARHAHGTGRERRRPVTGEPDRPAAAASSEAAPARTPFPVRPALASAERDPAPILPPISPEALADEPEAPSVGARAEDPAPAPIRASAGFAARGAAHGVGARGAPVNGAPANLGPANGAAAHGEAPIDDGERGATAPQLRRFIKSRAYVPMHELRRRFAINGADDEVTPVEVERRLVFVGLPQREGRLLGELLRGGDIGYELSMDPITPIVVGVYPMRPVTRA